MAGLAAAAEARALGASVTIVERGDRAGGSMLLSSGVVWRYRDFDRFRAECPDGDPALQRPVFENLDRDLRWLESLGAHVVARETGNPRTAGVRFDPRSLTYIWTHADSRVDALHRALEQLVADGVTSSREDMFARVWDLAHQTAARRAPARAPLLSRAAVPYLDEPWYC